jgi:predicted transposase YdaD
LLKTLFLKVSHIENAKVEKAALIFYYLLMGVNTKYKNSVFSFLFSDPDKLKELYCALEDVSLPIDVPVTINTLQDVLFMDRINDISFEIGGKLVVLIEHQSTINPNMPLRLLMYITRVYEKIIEGKKIYASRPIHLPRPEFFVLYNGTAAYPDNAILKLSDIYENEASLGLPIKHHPALELEVKVININHGRNEEITKRCKTLAGYSVFVSKVQEYEMEQKDRKEAMKKAVKYCMEKEILKDFFDQNATEVMNMLMTEWNWDDALAVRYEEGLEEGLDKGIEKGIEKGLEEGKELVARNALEKGIPLELISEITGLDMETLRTIGNL